MRDPNTDQEADRARLGRMIRATRDDVGSEDLNELVPYWEHMGWANVQKSARTGRRIVVLTPAGKAVADALLN